MNEEIDDSKLSRDQLMRKRHAARVGWIGQPREEGEDPIIFKLTNEASDSIVDNDYTAYAPKDKGSYYLKLTPADVNSLFKSPLNGPVSGATHYYLSLKFLYDIALNQVDWTQKRPTPPSCSNPTADELLYMDFEELQVAPTEDSVIDCKAFSIPLRAFNENAKLAWLETQDKPKDVKRALPILKYIQEQLRQIWNDLHKRASTSGSFRGRFENTKLTDKLYIAINPIAAQRLRPHKIKDPSQTQLQTQSTNDILKGILEQINSVTNETKMEVRELNVLNDESKFIKISDNPFGLYSTYLTLDCFHDYMDTLGKEKCDTPKSKPVDPAVRRYPTRSKRSQMLKKIEAADQKKRSKPLTQNQVEGNKKVDSTCQYQSIVIAHISAGKIRDAKGKRDPKRAPINVMNMSAPQFAAEELDWQSNEKYKEGEKTFNVHQMSNYCYIAEWLHLSAFSWGGLLDAKVQSQHDSSDVPANLVLGTSETNSYMTRYEKAWQTLVDNEYYDYGNKQFTGTLFVIRNPREPDPDSKNEACFPVWQDCLLDKKYCRKFIQLQRSSNDLVQNPDDTAAELLGLCDTTIMPFLAYAINYQIIFNQGSRILGPPGEGLTLEGFFYPFLRPIYHTLEFKLDKALYEHMKVSAKEEAIVSLVPEQRQLGTGTTLTFSKDVPDETIDQLIGLDSKRRPDKYNVDMEAIQNKDVNRGNILSNKSGEPFNDNNWSRNGSYDNSKKFEPRKVSKFAKDKAGKGPQTNFQKPQLLTPTYESEDPVNNANKRSGSDDFDSEACTTKKPKTSNHTNGNVGDQPNEDEYMGL